MAWTSPMTFTDGSVLTAAQLNTHLRDNLAETAPARATAAGRLYVSTGANAIAERVPTNNFVGTAETETSTSYTDLATGGPTVTVTTGARAIVCLTSAMWNSGNGYTWTSYAVSGASTAAAVDAKGISERVVTGGDANEGPRVGHTNFETALTPGSNTFTAKYRVSAGTGRWEKRHLLVIPL